MEITLQLLPFIVIPFMLFGGFYLNIAYDFAWLTFIHPLVSRERYRYTVT
jgi:hypothetical protein